MRGFSPSLFNFLLALLGFKYCGADNWGEIAGLILVFFFFNFVANWGNKDYLIRAYSERPQAISSLFFQSLTSRAVFLLLALPLFFYYPVSIAALGVLIIFCRYIYSSYESLIIYHQKFKTQFFAEFLGFIVVLAAILFNDQFSISYFLLAYLIASFVKTLYIVVAFKSNLTWQLTTLSPSLIAATIPFFLISLSGWLHSRIDLYIVEFNLSPAHLSKYQILVGAFLMLDAVSAFAVQPFSKHIYRLNPHTLDKMRHLLRLIGIPAVLLGSFTIYLFLTYVAKIEFDRTIYLIMTLGSIPPFFYMVDIFILYREKREKEIMTLGFIGAGINLVLCLVLIPNYGILGAVIGVCCAKWVMISVPFLVKNKKELKVNG